MTLRNNTKYIIGKGFIELLDERPFDKISVRDITEHCHLSRSTFLERTAHRR